MINFTKKRTIFGAVAGVALIAFAFGACSGEPPDTMQPTPPVDAPFADRNGYAGVEPNVMSIQQFIQSLDMSASYQAHLETTQGTFIAEIYPDCSPASAGLFIYLAESGFYDNTSLQPTMSQTVEGGEPPDGAGLVFQPSTCAERQHDAAGILSFVTGSATNTNITVFSITLAANPNLDSHDANGILKENCGINGVLCQPVFGKVIESFDAVVANLAEGDMLTTVEIMQANASGEFVDLEEFIPNVHDAEAFLASFDTSLEYTAEFQTSAGNFTAELYPQCSTISVSNFVYLATNGFYEDTTFHRVVDGFVIQGGDPTATGAGGPSYNFGDLSCGDYTHNTLGVLSMANRGNFNTNGSQFFVTISTEPIDRLDVYDADGTIKDCATQGVSCHPIFGRVTSGMDVVNSVEVGTQLLNVVISPN